MKFKEEIHTKMKHKHLEFRNEIEIIFPITEPLGEYVC